MLRIRTVMRLYACHSAVTAPLAQAFLSELRRTCRWISWAYAGDDADCSCTRIF